MKKIFYSTPELAELLGVFHTTVRRWIEGGKIKGVRVGRNYKIPAEEAIRVLDDHGIALPEILRRYKLQPDRDRLSPHVGRSGSILQRLLIVEEIEDPALICREDAILGANQAFADLVGFSQADLIGLDIAEVMDETSRDRLIEFAQRRLEDPGKGPSDHVGYLKTEKTGKKRVRITASSVSHTEGIFLLIIAVG